jgi:hypothetical protein
MTLKIIIIIILYFLSYKFLCIFAFKVMYTIIDIYLKYTKIRTHTYIFISSNVIILTCSSNLALIYNKITIDIANIIFKLTSLLKF